MIVPGNNNPLKTGGPGRSGGNVVPMQRPSETQLLMALAEMHRQGRFSAQPEMEAAAKKMPLDIRTGTRVPGGTEWTDDAPPSIPPPRMEELNK